MPTVLRSSPTTLNSAANQLAQELSSRFVTATQNAVTFTPQETADIQLATQHIATARLAVYSAAVDKVTAENHAKAANSILANITATHGINAQNEMVNALQSFESEAIAVLIPLGVQALRIAVVA